jgi:hypothetical protein
MPLTTKQRPSVSREVRKFAQERGLTGYLPGLIELFDRVFADAIQVAIAVDEDPEIAGLRHLTFRAVVPWSTFEQAEAARDAWYAGTAGACPPESLPILRLQIDRRPA